ncbi:MAG TPA: von Willebrand factor type A domain-containing protein, partial [Rariglobus sp.]
MMALLAAVIIPTVGKVQKKASRVAALAEIRQAEQLRLIESLGESAARERMSDEAVSTRPADPRIPAVPPGALPTVEEVVSGPERSNLPQSNASAARLGEAAAQAFFRPVPASAPLSPPAAPPPPSAAGSDLMVADSVSTSSGVREELSARNNRFGGFAGGLGAGGKIQAASSEKAFDAEQDVTKRGEIAFADKSDSRRLESVAAEVRRRQRLHPDPAADLFSAPASAPPADAVSSNKKTRDEGGAQGSASGLLGDNARAANQPAKGLEGLSRADMDGNPFIAELEKGKTPADDKKQAQLAAQGRSQYLAGDLSVSQETFRSLEAAKPENAEAKSFLGRIAKEKGAIAELGRVKTDAQMIEEVSSAWRRPGRAKDATAAATPGASLEQRLDQIIIPSINFSGVSLNRAISTLSTVSEEYDGNAGGLNMVIAGQQGDFPDVTISLRNLSLRRVLDLITESTGYRYEIRDNIVVIERAKAVLNSFDELVRAEIPTATESVSTFSLHVSDASFRLAKAALERGQTPDPETIRPEEFYNAFDYGDPSPAAGEAVNCRVEQAAHPFLQQRNLVRIAMKVPAS